MVTEHDRNQLRPIERLSSPGDLKRPPGRRGTKVGSWPESFGGEHIDAHTSTLVAVRQTFRRDASEREASRLDGQNKFSDSTGYDPGVHQYIEIGGHPWWLNPVLECMKEDHLPTDEGPLARPQIRQLDQRRPEKVVVTRQCRQMNRLSVNDRPSGHSTLSSSAPARCVRGSSDSSRSTATTALPAET